MHETVLKQLSFAWEGDQWWRIRLKPFRSPPKKRLDYNSNFGQRHKMNQRNGLYVKSLILSTWGASVPFGASPIQVHPSFLMILQFSPTNRELSSKKRSYYLMKSWFKQWTALSSLGLMSPLFTLGSSGSETILSMKRFSLCWKSIATIVMAMEQRREILPWMN